jgi:hypothetical protein
VLCHNIGASNPALLNPQVAGPTVITSIPHALNPVGQAEQNAFMSSLRQIIIYKLFLMML